MNNKNQLKQLPDFVYVIVDAKWTNPNRITLILNKEFYNEHKKRVTMHPFKFNSRSYGYELTSHEGNMIVLKSLSVWGCLLEEDFIGVSSSPVGYILCLPEDFPCDPDQAVKCFEQELSSRKYDKSINRILCEHKADKGLTISLDKERYINPMFWGSLH